MFERLLKINPDQPVFHNNRGIALRDLKRHAEALESYGRALKIKPDYAEAFNNRGNAFSDLKRHEEALESYERALKLKPDYAEAFSNRGNALSDLKRHEEALESYERALKIKPDYAQAWYDRGNVLRELKRFEDALESYQHALKIKHDYVEAFNSRGNALLDLTRHEEALDSYQQALKLKPDFVEALYNRGNALRELKRHLEALESYERVLKLKPDHADALNNRGIALYSLSRPEEALDSFEHALKIKPDYAEAFNNRGNALRDLKRHEEALENFATALRLKPDYANAHFNESLCSLLMGDFDLGWRKYEWRWKRGPLIKAFRNFEEPLWLGDAPLAGKTLLLHAEQGFGDTLQFCRYVPMAAAQGARVVLEVPPALRALCQTLVGVETLLATGETLPRFDFHAPLMSLPLAFGTRLDSIPANIPYLHVDPARVAAWHALPGQRNKPRVGLAWSGRPDHLKDHERSLPFALLDDLIEEEVEFICLQKEFRSQDEPLVRQQTNMRIFSEQLTDFADTAALIETLDLVITVDTSVAHLAGALGKPVWILLPFAPDFRWLLDREDSPWYPSARLYRQPRLGQWPPVLAEVRQALAAYVPCGTAYRRDQADLISKHRHLQP